MNKRVMGVVLGMVATAAMAEGGRQAGFEAADANRDGAITRKEAASFSALEKGFDAADLNGNGLIEPEEYARLEQAETNADKK